MQKTILIIFGVIFFAGNVSLASTAQYYVGEQTSALGPAQECFLEASFSADLKTVDLRSIVNNEHEGHLVPVGPLKANYQFVKGSVQSNAYYFEDAKAAAPIRRLILISANPGAPTELLAAIFHDGHHDPVTCKALVPAVDGELEEAIELFSQFENLEEAEHAH